MKPQKQKPITITCAADIMSLFHKGQANVLKAVCEAFPEAMTASEFFNRLVHSFMSGAMSIHECADLMVSTCAKMGPQWMDQKSGMCGKDSAAYSRKKKGGKVECD